MLLSEVKREKGVITDLDSMVYVLDFVLNPERDKKHGEHILPVCILLSKMFGMRVVRSIKGSFEKHYLLYKGHFYDPELLIESTSEHLENNIYHGRMEYAEVKLWAYDIIAINAALNNERVGAIYDRIIEKICNYLDDYYSGRLFRTLEEEYRDRAYIERMKHEEYDYYDDREIVDFYEDDDGEAHAVYSERDYYEGSGEISYDDLEADYYEAEDYYY